MLIPPRESLRFLSTVRSAVIDTRDTAFVAADVVGHRFDDVRLHADRSHASGSRAAQIMKRPMLQRASSLIQSQLRLGPPAEWPLTATEDEVAAVGLPAFFQENPHGSRNRNVMGLRVLRPVAREFDMIGGNFRPA